MYELQQYFRALTIFQFLRVKRHYPLPKLYRTSVVILDKGLLFVHL
ncbi:hypothetical protein LDVICp125 [lymphocystis disease virus-China]|uniref:Uncharacterized protein n=1 Tax=lymphocystis disease virus-China TaxID=256729 RepID=Q677Y7_9VIRU|nr:hypothetical protein LDVICp125 [lymphocystis disease virus-China]AAU10970.1 hypothetical protein [lymphocystis disease virus-China]